MENETNQPALGMVGCDRDLFARVWARVEPQPSVSSPIEVLSPAQTTPPEERASTLPVTMAADTPGEDFPTDVPCLGRAGTDHNAFLQELIRIELNTWRTYQALAARGGMAGRTLASIGADERRHAKQLSAAYFLISGIRFFPDVPRVRPGQGSFWGMLRSLFWEEQRASAVYAAAAAETADPCLAELYRSLSAQEAAHADLLRGLAERM